MARSLAGILSALVLVAAATAASAERSVPSGGPSTSDANGNKIFDELDGRLAGLGSSSRVPVIVTLNAPATRDRVAGLMQQLGGFDVSHRFAIIPAFAAELTKGQIEAAARLPQVAHVEGDLTVHATNAAGELAFGVTKARADVGVNGNADGNASSYSKTDMVAAVIDTGIDANHLDLDEGKVIGWKDLVGTSSTPYDDNGHGTHVAATIAGDGDARADRAEAGVAPGAALVGVKVLDSLGNGADSTVAAGLDWVAQNKDTYGIRVVNMSLGGSGCSDGADAVSTAVNNLVAAGVVVVVAAGNAGPGICTVSTPAAATGAETVGAMADLGAGGFKQAYFSSRGPTLDGRIKPDVSAPGVNVVSAKAGTTNGYTTLSGTSMATPFVAGVALLMLQVNPGLTPQQVKTDLAQSAVDWGRGGDDSVAGSTGADIDYGAGRLDAYAAIAAAGAGISAPPAVPGHLYFEGSLGSIGDARTFSFNVSDTSVPIAATMVIASLRGGSSRSTNFDLKLINPAGSTVATAATTRRQEDLSYTPTQTGTYTVRVNSYAGSGSFFVDVSAGTAVAPPPPPPPPPPPDTTPPTITSVSPADGASGVTAGTAVSVSFSEAMNQSSSQAAFSLVNSTTLAAVAGAFSWSGNTMTFTPSVPLAALTQFTAKVAGGAGGAKDVAGNALAADKTWSFTTASAPTVTTAFPTSTTIVSGTLRSGSVANLAAEDSVFYELNSSLFATEWYGSFTSVPAAPANLKVTYAGKNSVSCTQTISIWKWSTSAWVQLDSRSVGSTVVEIADLAPSGAGSDYVSGTGELRVRVRCSTFLQSFYASGDLLKITYS